MFPTAYSFVNSMESRSTTIFIYRYYASRSLFSLQKARRKELHSCCQSPVEVLPSLFTGDLLGPGGEEGAHHGHVLQLGAEELVTGLQWVNRHKKRLRKCLCLCTGGAEQGWGNQDTALAGFGLSVSSALVVPRTMVVFPR